jgi:hypothetical protein
MGLSNDQKAILRLLSQRGEDGYADLAALMDIDATEVHERAQAAAAELESEGIPAPAIPPPPAATATAEPSQPAQPAAPAPQPPAAPAPSPPVEPVLTPEPARAPPSQPAAAARAKPAGKRPKLALPASGGARAALAAGAAVVVLLIAILALGGGDSNDSSPPSASTGSGTGEETVAASSNPKLTQAVLSPVDGSAAKGLATFGRVKNTLALQIEAEGLKPTAKGQSYTVWLYQSAKKKLPLASTAVDASGKIGAQVEVPTEVLAYLANETFDQLDISRTSDAALKASLAKATSEKKAPIYTGTDVLRGQITGPIIGAARKK